MLPKAAAVAIFLFARERIRAAAMKIDRRPNDAIRRLRDYGQGQPAQADGL